MLPPVANGLILLDHAGYHIREAGIGLRHVVDWMMYVHGRLTDDYWYEQFAPAARAMGLESFAITMTQMCRIYLGLPDPITWCSGADVALCERLMAHIFRCGNFGAQQSQDQGWVSSKAIHILHKPRTLFGWLKFLQVSGMNHWEAARRHKFLRPFAWIYGGCRCLKLLLGQEDAFSKLSADRKTVQDDRNLFEALDI